MEFKLCEIKQYGNKHISLNKGKWLFEGEIQHW